MAMLAAGAGLAAIGCDFDVTEGLRSFATTSPLETRAARGESACFDSGVTTDARGGVSGVLAAERSGPAYSIFSQHPAQTNRRPINIGPAAILK